MPTTSSRRAIAPQHELNKYSFKPILHQETNELIGVEHIPSKYAIQTSQSNSIMYTEQEQTELTQYLQEAQKILTETTPIKQLKPPEIVFVHNILTISHHNSNQILNFNYKDALGEWAEAHAHLTDETCSYRGVSVLQTIDAKLWSSKKQNSSSKKTFTSAFDPDMTIGTRREHYFDWTYSTPYTGTCSSNFTPQEKSGIKIEMLKDTTQPILFYGELTLFEDDLHDNGDVNLSLKIRIMPLCWYVLMRLYVRVDQVLVRCRDVRLFGLFNSNRIEREITWREWNWNDDKFPTDVKCWILGSSKILDGLLNRLPLVDLPSDIPRFSYLEA